MIKEKYFELTSTYVRDVASGLNDISAWMENNGSYVSESRLEYGITDDDKNRIVLYFYKYNHDDSVSRK